jgi:hypothetical protein
MAVSIARTRALDGDRVAQETVAEGVQSLARSAGRGTMLGPGTGDPVFV